MYMYMYIHVHLYDYIVLRQCGSVYMYNIHCRNTQQLHIHIVGILGYDYNL